MDKVATLSSSANLAFQCNQRSFLLSKSVAVTCRRPIQDLAPVLNGINASRGQSPRKRDGLKVSGSSQYLATFQVVLNVWIWRRQGLHTIIVQTTEIPNDHAILGDRNADAFTFVIGGHEGSILCRSFRNVCNLGEY